LYAIRLNNFDNEKYKRFESKMFAYLTSDLIILIIALLFSFNKKIKFYENFFAYLFSVSIVSTSYLIWEILSVNRGDLSFSATQTTKFYIFKLPIEELLFFLIVPYVVILIYEVANSYRQEKIINFTKNHSFLVAIAFFLLAFIFIKHNFTFVNLLLISLVFYLNTIFKYQILNKSNIWFTNSIIFIPLIIFFYFKVSLPMIFINPMTVIGLKVIKIPIEYFFYSFSMVSLWIICYEIGKNLEQK